LGKSDNDTDFVRIYTTNFPEESILCRTVDVAFVINSGTF
jgi:hypothetical protein